MTTRNETPIGGLLTEKREDAEASQTQIAARLGVSRNAYRAWETGHNIPGDEYATALAEYLEIPIKEVVWMLYRERTKRGRQAPIIHGMSLGRWTHRPTDNRPQSYPAAA